MSTSASSWRELVPGLVLTAVITALVWGILRYMQVGALRGETLELLAPVSSARGIMKGSEVWLGGFRVGKVKGVEFRPPVADTAARVVVRLQVLAEHRRLLRRDSWAQIRSGGTLIGAPVIHITPGTSAGAALTDGDTLRTKPQFDTEGISSQIALASRHFPEIISNVKAINTEMGTANGTVGAFLGDDDIQLEVVGSRASAVARSLSEGRGTVGLALRNGGDIMARAQRVMASADTLKALVMGEQSVAGRFRKDSTLLRDVRTLLDEVTIVRAQLAEPRGTAGRALHDRAAYDRLTQLERELGALMADIKRRPLRYVVF
jgi:phospholipid/cholesterol/gamma-HCH transport system substrate-binding protein